MKNTYREILKWGDKHEEKIDAGTLSVLQKKFEMSDEDVKQKRLMGDSEVKLEKKISLDEIFIKEFKSISGNENVMIDDYSRAAHSFGKFYTDLLNLRNGQIKTPPDVVIYPRSDDEIQKIIKICNDNNIAVTPFAGHSSVTRGVETPKGGVSLDLTKHFNKVIEVNEINSSVRVQTGIYGPAFEDYLNNYGDKYSCGHFPQSFEYSTVGGWVAARSAGQASTGYGKIDDMVLAMKVITPSGIIKTKDYPSTAQAWDLNKIFIGSEGTLGIITEITMKIRKFRPQNTSHSSFIFKNFESAVEAMRAIMQAGIGKPHLFRISDPEESDIAFKTKNFDNTFADKFIKTLGYKTAKRCLMFVAVEGDKDYAKFVKSKVKIIAKKYAGFFLGGKPTKKWLEQRYSSAYLREPLMDIGIMTDTIETAVAWDKLFKVRNEVIKYLKKREKTVVMIHISHVYENGANLYITFLSPMQEGNELEDYVNYHKGLVDTIHKYGGSLSHHHGIGRSLAPWMNSELGKDNMALLQAIKNHLDPKGIMNPDGSLGLK
ncbi:MAG: FAD-binding oxidoreductase [Bacteroidota bacterium]|nr:FAD-binding oxidoreductase [Bacteroidota bacterium]